MYYTQFQQNIQWIKKSTRELINRGKGTDKELSKPGKKINQWGKEINYES